MKCKRDGLAVGRHLPRIGRVFVLGAPHGRVIIRRVLPNIWMVLGRGWLMVATATAFNLFGDGLRDLFDPRLVRSGKP